MVNIVINFKPNNTLLTVSRANCGSCLAKFSLGIINQKSKINPANVVAVVNLLVSELNKLKINQVCVFLKGFNKTRNVVVKQLSKSDLTIVKVLEVISRSHNGCRLKKKRRL